MTDRMVSWVSLQAMQLRLEQVQTSLREGPSAEIRIKSSVVCEAREAR